MTTDHHVQGHDLTTLFRILQRHYPQFMEVIKFQLSSRREFERLSETDPQTLTDLQRLAFGGKVTGRNFGVERHGPARFDLNRLGPILEEVHERLSGVIIENLDWRDFIARYDREGALFYLDPPYYGSERDYGKDCFKREDFSEMAELLSGIKGRFIVSLNDCPEVREIFSAFRFADVKLDYTVGSGAQKPVGEVIIFDHRGSGDERNMPLF